MNISQTIKNKGAGLPVRVLQIGEGNFLRAFADWMLHKSREAGVFDGCAVLCQPIEMGMKDAINSQNGLYTLLLRGIDKGVLVEEAEIIHGVDRCISPYTDFDALMDIAASADLKVIISNTTEAGIAYRQGDTLSDKPPVSYPAKLTQLLYHRYKTLGENATGLLILPVELIDRNGDFLKKYVLQYAREWELEVAFIDWLLEKNCFANTLVDRIVTGYPRSEIAEIEAKLGYEDKILVTAEPFHLWVIEAPEAFRDVLPLDKAGLDVVFTDDMTPYRTRKVRILNGAHTMSVLAAVLSGHETVLEMMNDKLFSDYLKKGIWEEIIPNIPLDPADMDAFGKAVLERFSNPFIRHMLLDISLNSVSKYKARCLPSLLDYVGVKKSVPPVLAFGLAALIAFYKGEGNPVRDDADVVEFFQNAYAKGDVVKEILGNEAFWGQDLTAVSGLLSTVEADFKAICEKGMQAAVKEIVYG